MSVELKKYMPAKNDYVFVARPGFPVFAGRVTGVFLYEGTVNVRPAGTRRYLSVPITQVMEHPQNHWGA